MTNSDEVSMATSGDETGVRRADSNTWNLAVRPQLSALDPAVADAAVQLSEASIAEGQRRMMASGNVINHGPRLGFSVGSGTADAPVPIKRGDGPVAGSWRETMKRALREVEAQFRGKPSTPERVRELQHIIFCHAVEECEKFGVRMHKSDITFRQSASGGTLLKFSPAICGLLDEAETRLKRLPLDPPVKFEPLTNPTVTEEVLSAPIKPVEWRQVHWHRQWPQEALDKWETRRRWNPNTGQEEVFTVEKGAPPPPLPIEWVDARTPRVAPAAASVPRDRHFANVDPRDEAAFDRAIIARIEDPEGINHTGGSGIFWESVERFQLTRPDHAPKVEIAVIFGATEGDMRLAGVAIDDKKRDMSPAVAAAKLPVEQLRVATSRWRHAKLRADLERIGGGQSIYKMNTVNHRLDRMPPWYEPRADVADLIATIKAQHEDLVRKRALAESLAGMCDYFDSLPDAEPEDGIVPRPWLALPAGWSMR